MNKFRWVTPLDKVWAEQEIHVGYHDPRAVIDRSAPTTQSITPLEDTKKQ